MTESLKDILGYSVLKSCGGSGGGCINQGQRYESDDGSIYVKSNSKDLALQMFEGEYNSLCAIFATSTIIVPRPVKVVANPSGGAFLVTEYVEMSGGLSRFAEDAGSQLARLHLHNQEMLKQEKERASWLRKPPDGFSCEPVAQFGFHSPTSCGYYPLINDWQSDWVEFYAQQRLQSHINDILAEHGNRELSELWPQLQRHLPSFFKGLSEIVPSLLHGDLWSGNIAETMEGPVIFDPASFYGHSEFDFGIAQMFGGFSPKFFRAYHSVIPKQPGSTERIALYELFHHLNHWKHFGSSYLGSSIKLLKKLCGIKH